MAWLRALSLLAVSVVLVACGSDDTGSGPKSEGSVSADTSGQRLKAEDYHRFVHDLGEPLASRTDEQLDTAGKAACGTLVEDEISSWVNVVKILTDAGIEANDAGGFIAYAVSTFCPEKKSALPAS